jgi:hypothetical protein
VKLLFLPEQKEGTTVLFPLFVLAKDAEQGDGQPFRQLKEGRKKINFVS